MYIDELHYGALIKKWTRVFSLFQDTPPPQLCSSIPLFSIAISMVIKDAASPAPVPQPFPAASPRLDKCSAQILLNNINVGLAHLFLHM